MAECSPSIELIDTYLELIQGNYIELQAACGLVEQALDGHGTVTEPHTGAVIEAWERFHGYINDRPPYMTLSEEQYDRHWSHWTAYWPPEAGSHDAAVKLRQARLKAASHVLDVMVVGGRLEVEEFPRVIFSSLRAASQIEGNRGTRLTLSTAAVIRSPLDAIAHEAPHPPTEQARAREALRIFKRACPATGRLALLDELL